MVTLEFKSGRYKIGIPWKEGKPKLANNYEVGLARLKRRSLWKEKVQRSWKPTARSSQIMRGRVTYRRYPNLKLKNNGFYPLSSGQRRQSHNKSLCSFWFRSETWREKFEQCNMAGAKASERFGRCSNTFLAGTCSLDRWHFWDAPSSGTSRQRLSLPPVSVAWLWHFKRAWNIWIPAPTVCPKARSSNHWWNSKNDKSGTVAARTRNF